MEDVVHCLVDWLTLGDLARLHETVCDRDTVSTEMRHIVRHRLGFARTPAVCEHRFTRMLSLHMLHSGTRCRECGVACRRQSLVCYSCASDVRSYRSMVSRNDLRTTDDGWTIKERRLLQLLKTVHIVTRTSNGQFFYWRREAVAALRSVQN